jgi:hypothetical protein
MQQFEEIVLAHHKSKRKTGTTPSSSDFVTLNDRRLVNDEPYIIWKEVVAAYFAVPFQDLT